MVVCDAVLRKLPGALGDEESAVEESFSAALEGAPEYPHYTRPAEYRGWRVPEVLLSGHHARIREWRLRAEPGAERRDVRYHRPPARAGLARSVRLGPDASAAVPTDPLASAMSTVIDSLERAQLRRVPTFDAGDRLRVHFQVIEGTRRRTQVFEGVVIKRQGHGARETFTVRKQSFGVGVERTFPLHSPKIERIEVAARGDVRRAKLYYLRGRVGKRARVRERRIDRPRGAVERELLLRTGSTERGRSVGRAVAGGRGGGGEPVRARAASAGARLSAGGRRRARGRASRHEPRDEPEPKPPATADRDRCDDDQEVGRELRCLELVVIVVVALGLALAIQAFIVKPYRIPSGSMLPTLHINQRVLVDRIGNDFSSPQVGDIFVFHPPKNYADGCAEPERGREPERPGQPRSRATSRRHSRRRRRSSSASSGCPAIGSRSATAT